MYRILIVLPLLLIPGSEAATLHFPSGASVGDVHADEDLVLVSPGDLTVSGTIKSTAAGVGVDGSNITFQVDGVLTFLPSSAVIAGSGSGGKSIEGLGRVAGTAGGEGGSILIEASTVVGSRTWLVAGDGGNGGDAFARGTPNALAIGGEGGDAGTIRLRGERVGDFLKFEGDGGDGGMAEARGDSGKDCTSRDGKSDTHRGENATTTGGGGEANAAGAHGTCGPWNGTGGRGGSAEAYGGDGGVSTDGNGGSGGDAFAFGGRGGDGRDACFATVHEAEAAFADGLHRAGNGGPGGWITAIGGDGGTGVEGGAGGNAFGQIESGAGGNATQPIAMGMGGEDTDPDNQSQGVKGGDGGQGITVGGGGGSAVAKSFGGDGGSHCGPLPYHGLEVPMPSAAFVLLALVVAAWWSPPRRSR